MDIKTMSHKHIYNMAAKVSTASAKVSKALKHAEM